jgi:hypothetical protein
MTHQETDKIKKIIRERCGFSSFPQDHMVDPIILKDIASRESISRLEVEKLYSQVRREIDAEIKQLEQEFWANYEG